MAVVLENLFPFFALIAAGSFLLNSDTDLASAAIAFSTILSFFSLSAALLL